MKLTIKTTLLAISLIFCGASQASLFSVNTILNGNDGGFGYSSLHEANDSSPMSGSILTTISSATGTYDDVSGATNLVFELANQDTLTLTGTLIFNGSGLLASNSELAYSGMTNLAASTFGSSVSLASSGDFGYLPGAVCCSGADYPPNSFMQDLGGSDLHYLTLWGADFGSDIFGGSYDGSKIGMDFRVELSAVPIPAAAWLFGSALIGLVGFSKRRKAA